MDPILAGNSPMIMYFLEEEDGDENEEDGESTSESLIKCAKLQLKKNIAACIERKELTRSINPVVCNNNLIENVTSNYIIAKEIISNLPWQEKLICKLVCSTWHSAVQALQKEQLSPEDFHLDLGSLWCRVGGRGWFKQSGIFQTEPLVILTFANTASFSAVVKCKFMTPCPCEKPCKKEHCLIDLVDHHINAPKNCMLTAKANYLVYRPIPMSNTYQHSITQYKYTWISPFIAGIFIPKIPDVGFQVLNIKSQDCLQQEFYDVVKKLSKDNIIKGVLVYVTEKYLLNSVEDIVFLNYFKDVQPNVPYALGGCIVEDTMSERSEINLLVDNISEGADFISENLLSIGMFTVPKTSSSPDYHFEMYSFVIESSEWTKPKIQQEVSKFSAKVPRFEHSFALKLSCVGRDQKHALEQDSFRAAFPNTPIVGCYGNGELGVHHPARPKTESSPSASKRHKHDPGPQFGIMYSYSTVFVYIGWGKVTSPKGPL